MKKQELFIIIVPFVLLFFFISTNSNSMILSLSCLPLIVSSFLFFKKENAISSFEYAPVLTFAEKKKLEKACPPATLFKISEQEMDFSEQQTLPIELPSPPTPKSRKESRY